MEGREDWTCPFCGQTQDGSFFCNHCGKANENNVINPKLNELGYSEVRGLNELGQRIIKKVDQDGNIMSVTTFANDHISEIIYDDNGKVVLTEKVFSNTMIELSAYDENGQKKYDYITYDDRDVQINYNADGKVSSEIETYIEGGTKETLYNDDGNIKSITKKNSKNKIYEETLLTYENGERKEVTFNGGKLTKEKYFYSEKDNDLRYYIDYEYDGNNITKKTIHQPLSKGNQINSEMINMHEYIYDENGKANVKNSFIVDGKKIITFNSEDISVEYYDGVYTFMNNDNNIYCEVDDKGNISYINCDKDETLHLNKDGTFNISDTEIKGKYSFNQDGNIICVLPNGDKLIYNCDGELIEKGNEKNKVQYNYDSNTEIKTINGNSKYRRINHVEYNEEDYYNLIKSITNIGNDIASSIASACSSISSICSSVSPEPIPCDTGSVINAANSQRDALNSLNTTINYSLLAYDTCDKDLKDSVDKYIIDNLFDDKETRIEKYFKDNIVSHLEDRDSDGILEYKKDTDFNELYEKLIPSKTSRDLDGNTLYFNVNNNLIGAERDNIKILYGDEKFNLSFTDNGAVKLIDKNGNPFNIFGEYNLPSCQFGGRQNDLADVRLLEDKNVMRILDSYHQFSSYEEKEQFLEIASTKGCGYTAITNAVFKKFEGKEDLFLDTFGYPMYNVTMNDKKEISVDYNYEPMILELFAELNGKEEVISYGINKGRGTNTVRAGEMVEFLNNKYGVSLVGDKSLFESYGVFGDYYYKIYDMNGKLLLDAATLDNGGGHAMTKLGESADGKWIVSSWGSKFLCETSEPRLY